MTAMCFYDIQLMSFACMTMNTRVARYWNDQSRFYELDLGFIAMPSHVSEYSWFPLSMLSEMLADVSISMIGKGYGNCET